MEILDIKDMTEKIIKETKHWGTIAEYAFEKGYDRGILEGLYIANKILQMSDVREYHLLDDIIKKYEDKNYK